MKLNSFHVYGIVIGLGGIIGAIADISYPIPNFNNDGWWGFGFGVGLSLAWGGLGLFTYHTMKYFFKVVKSRKMKSYI